MCESDVPCEVGEGVQGAELVQNVRADLVCGEVHRAPAEPARSGKLGCAPMPIPRATQSSDHGRVHDSGVTGMESAGDVGGRQHVEQCVVVAHRPCAEALAEVGDEIDLVSHGALPMGTCSGNR